MFSPFLAENHSSIDIEDLDLSLMAHDFETHTVYLSGAEWHGTKASYDLHFKLFTALHQQAGVNYLMLGMGQATTDLYTTYVKTGDVEILDHLHQQLRFTTTSNEEYRMFWENLHEYYTSLPEDEKIHIVSVDLEYQPINAINFLTSLPGVESLPLVTPPPGFSPSLNNLANYVPTLYDDVMEDESKYREALGDNFDQFMLVLNNLNDTVNANLEDNFYEARSRYMYKNFLRIYEKAPDAKFFGQWTMEHIYQHRARTPRIDGGDRFGTLLSSEDSPVAGKVLSIGSLYVDSSFRFAWGRFFEVDLNDEDFIQHRDAFKEHGEDGITLFRLTGEDSPFDNRNYLIKGAWGGVTTDYIQYLLLIKNSPSTSPNRKF